MSLNNIKLNSSLIADMYRDSLVETGEISHIQEENFVDPPVENKEIKKNKLSENKPIMSDWKYLGDYKKNILLIVRYANATYLPDEQLNFLTAILGACKLSLADIAILNISNAPSALYKEVQEKFKSTVTILFGLTPQEFEMPVNFPEFQVQPFNNCTFLHAPVLEKLESDKVLKSKLWVCLRRMFNLP